MVLYPAVSLVSINPESSHDHSARDARALAQSWLSLLLALEIASTGRAATNRDGAARADPADEHREPTFGARRASAANYASSGLRLRSRVSPNTWSSDAGRQARDGAPFCVIMLRTLPPWTCSLFQPLASICFMRSSSCGWIVEISFELTSQPIRRRSGLHVRSPRLFPGTWLRAI